MKKGKLISSLTFMVGIMMISIGMFIQNKGETVNFNRTSVQEFNIKNMSASANMIVKEAEAKEEVETENLLLTEVEMEVSPASVIIPPRVEVYQGMTMEELTAKLNRSLGGILKGHGDVIASYSLEKGVDPYIAAAIMIHETGNGTSRIANSCYNFGGQKGYGCGAYKKYNSVDEGLRGIIDNLYKNYYAYGLKTVESIGSKYAESKAWPSTIHKWINSIKAK